LRKQLEGILTFLESNSIYIVLFIVLTIWFGIFFYLNVLDKRLKEIETDIKGAQHEK